MKTVSGVGWRGSVVVRVAHAITCASQLPDDVAVRAIDRAWEAVDRVATLAEARMRGLMRRLAAPPLAAEPAWLRAARERAAADVHHNAGALESACRLVRAELVSRPDAQADLEVDVGGSIVVRWNESSLRWLVMAPRLPWPGAAVRSYWRPAPSDSARLESSLFHYAPAVVEHAAAHI